MYNQQNLAPLEAQSPVAAPVREPRPTPAQPAIPAADRQPVHTRKPAGEWVSTGLGIAILTAIIVGWATRDLRDWNPETGLPYALGIAGLSAVGLLLIYPFRKRIPVLRAIGSVPFWFRTHMLLGALAPLLILYHSNFSLGSINSNIALFTMLIVAGSGVVGRHLYVRVHRDMAGKKAAAREILAHAEMTRVNLATGFGSARDLIDDLGELEAELRQRPESIFQAIGHVRHAGREMNRIERELRREMKRTIKAVPRMDRARRKALQIQARSARYVFESYRVIINHAARLSLYERLFALWHVLHLPLFFLMVLAAAIHVVAVHLY